MTVAIVDRTLPEYFTLADLTQRLELRAGAHPSSRNTDMYIRAIQDTIRQLPTKHHDWRYYQKTLRFTTSATVSMTVSYDYTGGAYERLVTSTSGEFPSDAALGEVYINNLPYRIYKRISATQVQLHADTAPQSDIASTTEARWVRSEYSLPRRMTKVHALVNRSANTPLVYMTPRDFYESEYIRILYGYPSRYTITNIGKAGEVGIKLSPAPAESYTYECNLTVSPMIPHVHSVLLSDVATTADSTTLTSATASFSDKLINSLVRISYDATAPVGSTNLHKWQAFVVSVTNATTLVLSEPCPFTGTGQTALISSPIDIDADVMLGYVESEAFAQYCRNHKHESLKDAMALASMDFKSAVAADGKVDRTRGLDISGGITRWALDDFMYVVE